MKGTQSLRTYALLHLRTAVPGTDRSSVLPWWLGPESCRLRTRHRDRKDRVRTAGLDPEPNWKGWLSVIGDGVIDQSSGGDILDPDPNGFKHGSCRALGGLQPPEHLSRFGEDRGL